MQTLKTLATAHIPSQDPDVSIDELASRLAGEDAAVVVFFASPAHDGARVACALRELAPDAHVVGCSSAGEFTESGASIGGISAAAIPREKIVRTASALASFDGGVAEGMAVAIGHLEAQLGVALGELDPERHAGVLLLDGTNGAEEQVNDVLGHAAPLLSFVGGSAGDDLAFEETTVYAQDGASSNGAAILLMELAVPFAVARSCSFVPSQTSFRITKAEPERRIVWEIDGRPAADVYAEAVGRTADTLDSSTFMSSPVGLMIDGTPWIRSPQQVVESGGIKFYCQILEGMEVDLMTSTDLIEDTRASLERAAAELGGRVSGALLFNCILRRLEIDALDAHEAFLQALGSHPSCGFHTYGETHLGHVNQTLTGLLIG